jgi:DNA-binding response OmpR family regulator
MTFTTCVGDETKTRPTMVCVALAGRALPPPSALLAEVTRQLGRASTWHFVSTDMIAAAAQVDIALCDSAQAARTARRRWPGATVIALVPAHDDGTATVAALRAGAQVCVRGAEVALIVAYLQSVARRRGETTDGEIR